MIDQFYLTSAIIYGFGPKIYHTVIEDYGSQLAQIIEELLYTTLQIYHTKEHIKLECRKLRETASLVL